MVLDLKREYGADRDGERQPDLIMSPRLTGIGLLLIFLAGVMCLCGTLGYQNLVSPGPAASLEAHAEPAQTDPRAEHAGDHGPATVAYAATLLFVSAGAALYLVLGYVRSFRLSRSHLSVVRPPPKTAPLTAQVPVRSQLQIFLL